MGTITLLGIELESAHFIVGCCAATRCSKGRTLQTRARLCSPVHVTSGTRRSKSCVCNRAVSFGESGSKTPPQPVVEKAESAPLRLPKLERGRTAPRWVQEHKTRKDV